MRVEEISSVFPSIYDAVSHKESGPTNIGLLNGLSGDLLFQWHLSQFDPALVDQPLFENHLERLQQNLNRLGANHSLSSGFSGAGWFLEYINQCQGEDYDPDLCTGIDEILLDGVSGPRWRGEIEMVAGLAGVAIYAARRQRRTDQQRLFEKIISHYEALATQVSDTELAWPQRQGSPFWLDKENTDSPEYNLGLAHGVPGIMAALLPAYEIPELQDRVGKLLYESCTWLARQTLRDASRRASFFPTFAGGQNPSRLGWCYGDLTIALTLARVGNRLQVPTFTELAREVSLHSAARDVASGSVRDAGLCHGSAGLALIFPLLAKELDLPLLAEAGEKWSNHTLQLFQRGGLRGFHKYDGRENIYVESTGFLEGYAGIGLGLLATLGQDTDWTDCLLLS